jgi:hypothetical protein
MPSGLNELGLYSPTATQPLLEVHDTPASELSARSASFAGSGSGVGCIRQRLPSQPIAAVPAVGPTFSSVVPTAVQNLADTHDTPETMPGENGVGWTDQTRPRAGLTATSIRPMATTTPTLRIPGLIAAQAYIRPASAT